LIRIWDNYTAVYKALITYSIFQSLLFALVFFSVRRKESLALGIYFTHYFVTDLFSFLVSEYPHSLPLSIAVSDGIYSFIALLRPAITFYVLYSILGKTMPLSIRTLWLLPVLNFAVTSILSAINPELGEGQFYQNWYLNVPAWSKILITGLMVWQVRIFGREIIQSRDRNDSFRLSQLKLGRYFAFFYLGLSLITALYLVLTLSNGRLYTIHWAALEYSADSYNVLHRVIVCLYLLVFGYFSMRNTSVFYRLREETANVPGSSLALQVAEKTGILRQKTFSTGETESYALTLKRLMDEEKIFLDPKLSLNSLAVRAKMPTRLLSQFIQSRFQKSYKEYINYYRVEHASGLLRTGDKKRYTMYSIAFESGFNSESSFYKIFKEHTGLTPKQFQDNGLTTDKIPG
jgi:AraC-like DNA-binding protein